MTTLEDVMRLQREAEPEAGELGGAPSGSSILTFTGRMVNPLALKPEDICIEDIAHALSNQCRFSGHTRYFYSVAEHSCSVFDYVWRAGGSALAQLHALLHDASEAYLVDLPTPLKNAAHLSAYRLYEERAQRMILDVLAPTRPLDTFEAALVHEADAALLQAERNVLLPEHGAWPRVNRYPLARCEVRVMGVPAQLASRLFRDCYAAITRRVRERGE